MNENRVRKARLGRAVFGVVVMSASAVMVGGCLARPVAGLEPSTKTSVTIDVNTSSVDKVDLLFAIDNSASMGDKQTLLANAVPDLIGRLLNPQCINPDDATVAPTPSVNGACVAPLKSEFTAVYDLHIGIVSSSLGGGGANICADAEKNPVYSMADRHNNDKGQLLNRTRPAAASQPEGVVASASPVNGAGGNFLAWRPSDNPKNDGKTPPNVALEATQQNLVDDFKSLVIGTQEYGCGLEAQLESWYHFLIQPDPYASIELTTDVDPSSGLKRAALVGTDETIIKQRADFLRPDSLVAVIMLTDEEDSWSDPLYLKGLGWITRAPADPLSSTPTSALPRATTACASPIDPNHPTTTGPNDPNCKSCAFGGSDGGPNCTPDKFFYKENAEDNLNIRYTNDMQRRYGMSPQFPISRYVDGLKNTTVPNRNAEHKDGVGPYMASPAPSDMCLNPLFAAKLPTDVNDTGLCNGSIPKGPRTSDLIYFAIIGGVPWQLLADDQGAFKSTLQSPDWVKILGQHPEYYDLTGIDPHMIESYAERTDTSGTIPYLTQALSPSTASDTADPYNGREWDTTTSPKLRDLQYACSFTLPAPKDCLAPENINACDCDGKSKTPLCDATVKTKQVRGKAYPTIRELRVAKELGPQAIVASLCPKDPINTDINGQPNPDYGYRPAVTAIIDRLKNTFDKACLPSPLTRDANGAAPCLVLEALGPGTDQSVCDDPTNVFSQPDSAILARFNDERLADAKAAADGGANVTLESLGAVCQLNQLNAGTDFTDTCEVMTTNDKQGWCYVTGAAAGQCPQAIKFSSRAQPKSGVKTDLRCIQQSGTSDGG